MRATYRRPRGADTVPLNMFVAPDVKRAIEQIASAAGAPQWAVVEAAIRAGTPGKDGVPAGWELPRPDSDALIDGKQYRKTA